MGILLILKYYPINYRATITRLLRREIKLKKFYLLPLFNYKY